MKRKSRYLLIVILALFGFSLWSIVPMDRSVMGREGLSLGLDLSGGSYLVYQADTSGLGVDDDPAEIMRGVKEVIERRINAQGIDAPVVEAQEHEGEYSIAVQLPGVSDVEEAKKKIGGVALLEFRERDEEGNWIPAVGTIDGEELVLSSKYFKENTVIAGIFSESDSF